MAKQTNRQQDYEFEFDSTDNGSDETWSDSEHAGNRIKMYSLYNSHGAIRAIQTEFDLSIKQAQMVLMVYEFKTINKSACYLLPGIDTPRDLSGHGVVRVPAKLGLIEKIGNIFREGRSTAVYEMPTKSRQHIEKFLERFANDEAAKRARIFEMVASDCEVPGIRKQNKI